MNIGEAIQAMKNGERVCRAGWNGKGMWLALTNGTEGLESDKFWNESNKAFAESNGGTADVLSVITMKTADDKILMGWLASQTDLLADDWEVFKEPVTEATIADLKEQLSAPMTDDQKLLAMGIAETLGIDLDSPNEEEGVI